jgi:hypothetical protein
VKLRDEPADAGAVGGLRDILSWAPNPLLALSPEELEPISMSDVTVHREDLADARVGPIELDLVGRDRSV